MKKTILAIVIALTGVLAAMAEGPSVNFTTLTHDFGVINEADGPVEYDFVFYNNGDAPLVIVSANASCGCTLPRIPAKPVRPGESEKIHVTYLPQGRPGEFNKTIRVRTNVPGSKAISLKINGVVLPKQ